MYKRSTINSLGGVYFTIFGATQGLEACQYVHKTHGLSK